MTLLRPTLLAILSCALSACPSSAPPAGDASSPSAPDTSPPPSQSLADTSLDRFEWPSLHLTTVTGEAYDLADHRGHWVVVNFWATWCTPCLKEMPELSALHTRRGDINVIGLAYEEIEPESMHAFLSERPVSYPVAIIDVDTPPPDFVIPRGLPTTYLIAPDGKLARQFLGPVTAGQIERVVSGEGESAREHSAAEPVSMHQGGQATPQHVAGTAS